MIPPSQPGRGPPPARCPGVPVEYLVVGGLDAVDAQDGPETRDYPALPVHERPVAVERKHLVLVCVQHDPSSSSVLWLSSAAPPPTLDGRRGPRDGEAPSQNPLKAKFAE